MEAGIVSDHTDGTLIQHVANNVDACTHCAYLFLLVLPESPQTKKNCAARGKFRLVENSLEKVELLSNLWLHTSA